MTLFKQEGCELCEQSGGLLIWQNDFCRVVLVDDPHFKGFTRVILQQHVKEMTDLSPEERQRLLDVVWLVEQEQRQYLQPEKVNVASLGNMTPHIHWHVIPRFPTDINFPNPVWHLTETQKNDATHLDRPSFSVTQMEQYLSSLVEVLDSTMGL